MNRAAFWRYQTMVWGGIFSLGMLAAAPAFAGDQDFTLHNETGVDIYELYVSPASTDAWEEDVLGVDVLEDGASVEIGFDRSEAADYWDLKVVDGEGSDVQWYRLKLTAISEITLRLEDGEAIAEVR